MGGGASRRQCGHGARCQHPRQPGQLTSLACPHPVAAGAWSCCVRACCPPQVWLKGLLALAPGTTIWAIATEPESHGGGGHFKRKLLDTAAWASDEQCNAASFDPCYRLPDGDRASSILDWEARIFAMVAKDNGLVVKRFVGYGKGKGKVADWYPVPHRATDNTAQDV